MRKILLPVLLILFLLSGKADADFFPSGSQFDPEFALEALQIAELCYAPSRQEAALTQAGFRKVGLFNASRSGNELRHVATYAVYDRLSESGRTEVIIAIRGTGDGEWKLNLDLMPSGNYDLPYAENFSLAAEDILSVHRDYLDSLESPVFLVTGHSRGAAVANILGARLTDIFHAENVYAYTFATPGTVRGEYRAYSNIFNVINPADVITCLPFPQWGFERYGSDILLPVEDASLLDDARRAYGQRADREGPFPSPQGRTAAAQQFIDVLNSLAPQVRDGFTVRHALKHPGIAGPAEEGMTAVEFMAGIFDGNILAEAGSAGHPENDFTPVLQTLRMLSENGGYSWISDMHMPAFYGAWLSVMRNPE